MQPTWSWLGKTHANLFMPEVSRFAGSLYTVLLPRAPSGAFPCDLRRRSSPTFGVWDGYMLTTDAHERLWVPPGCAHGFLVVSDTCDFHYKCTKPYAPETERAVRWNDPDLAIDWPLQIGMEPLLSPKDAAASSFADCEKYD